MSAVQLSCFPVDMVNDEVSLWLQEMLSDEDLLHFEFEFTKTSERDPKHTFRTLRLSSFFRKKKDEMKRIEENRRILRLEDFISYGGIYRTLIH